MRRFIAIAVAIAAALVLMVPTGCEDITGTSGAEAATTSAISSLQSKADTNAALISGLTGRVAALEGQSAGEVSQASFNGLQQQVNTLTGELEALRTRVDDLESELADTSSSSSGSSSAADVVSQTRWRLRPDFSIANVYQYGTTTPIDPGFVSIGISSIEPRTIKEADIYEIVIKITNLHTTYDLQLDNIVLQLTFEPNDSVIASDECGVYQVAGPYNIYWDSEVRTSTSTGICRYIKAETDEFDLRVNKESTTTIELEFELIYG